MGTIETFFKKYAPAIQLVLVLIAICFFSWDITRPLVDYDEATYAKVIVNTLHSGNILTFQLSGHNWFEKPPLLLWLTMGSVQVFGENEFAFRIFAILVAKMSVTGACGTVKGHHFAPSNTTALRGAGTATRVS